MFKINFIAILISIILSLLTIYLSSKKIAKKASQTLPIEAIRNPGEITLKKKIKYPKFINFLVSEELFPIKILKEIVKNIVQQ